jgi:hypothetical protein
MDKKIAGLLGAAAALTTMTGAQAAPVQPTGPAAAMTYRDLLDPIPNAVPMLQADNARLAEAPNTEVAQITIGIGHHHHHHHIRIMRHHHHHHHSRHHHHHHHHHD